MVAAPAVIEQPSVTPVDLGGDVLASAVPGYLSGMAGVLAEQARFLPVPGDDLQRDFGYRFYEQIALDPQVAAAERILLTAALNAGVSYAIPTPRRDPAYAQAARLQRFVQEAFTRLPRPLESLLYEMGLAARQHGHKLCEAVWTTAKVLPNYGPQRIYQDLKPKPLGAYVFVADGYANTLGISPRLGVTAVYGTGVLANGRVNGQPVYALPDKFPVLTWGEVDRDLRGRSAYRCIYSAWWKKRQAEPGLLAYLARFGQPSLKITMPPNVPDKIVVDGVEYRTADYYKTQGLTYQSGGVYVQPNGADAMLQEANGDGAAYIAAEHLWNQEILMGLTGQTLATSEGTAHRSGADSRTHQDMLGLLVTFLKAWLSDFANRLLVAPLIVANFGAAALPLAPRVDLGRISPEDLAAMANAIGQLVGQGFWDPTKMPPDIGAELDTRYGFPQRQIAAVGPSGTPTDQPEPAQPPQPSPDQPAPEGAPA